MTRKHRTHEQVINQIEIWLRMNPEGLSLSDLGRKVNLQNDKLKQKLEFFGDKITITEGDNGWGSKCKIVTLVL